MCGIAGFTHGGLGIDKAGIDKTVIHLMTASISHRGPDSQDCFWTEKVALGAVRLRVIDLKGGEQPFTSADDDTAIVYNGEIYNFLELRRDLETRGHRFRSRGDTEVALRAFLEWDTGCFDRFRGMFAMAIWSGRDQRLVLARDRMGIKPLYIRQTGRDIVFGSELKALFCHPRVTRQLDLAALGDFLSLNYVPSPRTLVSGIEKLPSGHYLEWIDGRTSITPYWQLRFAPDPSIREEAAAEELDHLLRASVREHLVSDVPLGIWASGGIDSSTLVHHAAMLSGRPLKTFSIAFPAQGRPDAAPNIGGTHPSSRDSAAITCASSLEAKSCDESVWFRDIARRYGTDHHEFELTRETDLTSAIEEFAWFSDEPGADSGALPVWFLSKMSRQHVTVALSGEGGDELFGGYMTYRADQLARPLRRLPRMLRGAALRTARSLLPVSDAKISFEYKLKRWLEGSLLNPDEAHLFWNGAFSAAQKRALLPNMPGVNLHRLRDLYDDLPPASEIGFVNRYMLLDQLRYLQDNLLCKVDRMSMAHSLEVRPPFLDHRIVQFAARLPEHLKIRGSGQKLVLKRAMEGKLPPSVLNRKKAGLDIPAHAWFRGPLLPLLEDTLADGVVRNTSLFNPDATKSLIRDHKDRRINAGYQLWGLLTLFLWIKKWNIEVAPGPEREAPQETPARSLFATVS